MRGSDLIAEADNWLGQPYDQTNRIHPGYIGPTDCSGLITNVYARCGGQLNVLDPSGLYVSVTIWDAAKAAGLAISRDQAYKIAGAVLLIPDDPDQGWGDAGHIGFSDGVGGTREATPPEVQHLSVYYQPWGVQACLLPGVDYTNAPTPAPPVSLPKGTDMIGIGTDDGSYWIVADTWTWKIDSRGYLDYAKSGLPHIEQVGLAQLEKIVALQNKQPGASNPVS